MKKDPRAILFDWDNTLVDGWAAIEAGLNAAFREFGLPQWDRAQVLANVRRALRESFPELFGAEWGKGARYFLRRSARLPFAGAATHAGRGGSVASRGRPASHGRGFQ